MNNDNNNDASTTSNDIDMDAIFDEALDDLDDDDDDDDSIDGNDDDNDNNISQRERADPLNQMIDKLSEKKTAAATTTTSTEEHHKDDTTTSHNALDSAMDPSDIFQQMLRNFIENDENPTIDEKNNHGDNDKLGQFMEQVQAQIDAATSKTSASTTSNAVSKKRQSAKKTTSEKKKSGTSKPTTPSNSIENQQVEDTIAAILGEMAKANLQDPENIPTNESSNAIGSPSNNEKQLLQEMLQSLATGKLPDGFSENGEFDTDDYNPPDNFNPDSFLDGMMEQLLSKELMYEPMKQVVEKYPSWLETHKPQISDEEWNQRNAQYQCFQELVAAYEEQESSNNKKKNKGKQNTEKLIDLMQKVQEFGQPPIEIINEIAPDLQLDEEGMPKLDGFPFGSSAGGGDGTDGECLIM